MNRQRLIEIQEKMGENVKNYRQEPNVSHFRTLGKFNYYWTKIYSRTLCFGCLVYCCQVFLPCGHALCEACFRNVASLGTETYDLRTKNGPLGCSLCPFCQRNLHSFSIELPPPTASGRILALDGGGCLGIVTLKMLESFSREIDLGVPFHFLFDGIWGTSVGIAIHCSPRLERANMIRRHTRNFARQEKVDVTGV